MTRIIVNSTRLQYRSKQFGVTLLEITVILVILIALAGLMIPYYSTSVRTTTQDSTSASSLAEMDKLMQVYRTMYLKEPNNMEALINGISGTSTTDPDCTGAVAAADKVYCKIICINCLSPLTLNTEGVMSLNMAGITTLYYNDPDTTDATLQSIVNPEKAVSVVAQVSVPATWNGGTGATIEDYLASVFGTTSNKFDANCYDYIAFGIGNRSSLTGSVMSTAPVYFSDQPGNTGQTLKYNRFIVLYQVDKTNSAFSALHSPVPLGGSRKGCPTGIEPARFIGSVVSGDTPNGPLTGLATQIRSAENAGYND